MSNVLVGRRYAQAVLDSAESKGCLKQVADDFAMMQTSINDSKDLKALLKSPIVKNDKKYEILKQIFESKVSKETILLVDLLVRKGRAEVFADVISEFQVLMNEKNGIITVKVETAIEMNDALKSTLTKKLESITSKKVLLDSKINPSLIGGFTARIGDTVLDGSIRRKLDRLKDEFEHVALN
jgi:F-type H+-transporting ATPase subunit delta